MPKFFSSVTTRISLFGYRPASFKDNAVVSSEEPSSTTRISYVRLDFADTEVRWSIVVESMDGRRDVSLYAGTTTVRSTSLGPLSDGNGMGFSGDKRDR